MTVLTRPRPTTAPTVHKTMEHRRMGLLPTAILLLGAVYCLLPVGWVVIASTKSPAELFATSTLRPGTGLPANLRDLSAYRHGLFWIWMRNTVLYAGGGAALSTMVSILTGYTLSKYRFHGREVAFTLLIGGVLVPAVVLAIPQYFLLVKAGLAGGYLSVLLPSILSPYGIYLSRIYADAAVDDSLIEAARLDGAGELRILLRVGVPLMVPGMVTVFLFQFVAIWNNFLLPFVMLSDDHRFPLTVGLFSLMQSGANQPALYNLVIIGSLLSIIPLIILFLTLQRYWRVGLSGGAVK
jgi:multiple sugar transport system permease protein